MVRRGSPNVELLPSAAIRECWSKSENMRKPKTIDAYLTALSDDQRAALTKLRQVIRAAVPEAEECISYDIPAYRLDGRFFVGFAAAARHCAFYPGSSPIEAHQGELKAYSTSKGTIRFRADQPLPAVLVRKLLKVRIAEYARKRRATPRES
jgi:uncharacterized protein YdhG (YjbR/CyaY superfamily)